MFLMVFILIIASIHNYVSRNLFFFFSTNCIHSDGKFLTGWSNSERSCLQSLQHVKSRQGHVPFGL